VLPPNVRLDRKVIAGCKHSSLFGLVISNEEKKFYNIDSWSLYDNDDSFDTGNRKSDTLVSTGSLEAGRLVFVESFRFVVSRSPELTSNQKGKKFTFDGRKFPKILNITIIVK
jgi:hypothetical protein